jgi:DNA-binding MarR family transcriptional regulator/GNAT superfamily N-acetyltransferase
MADPRDIDEVRAFNRFYTARLGLTRTGVHRSRHPLAEARVLYELDANGVMETPALRAALAIDGGQLSRLLARLEAKGLIEREASPDDRRRQRVRLTEQGAATAADLQRNARDEIGALLDQIPDPQRALNGMREIRRAIAPPTPRTVVIRDHLEPGELGWLIQRHGELYAREYGWDQSFERLVARIASEFNPQTDRAWVAEVDGTKAGIVLCVRVDDTTAQLRTLLVEPHARGLGVGTRLVEAVIRHAKAAGYDTLKLWTNHVLTSAIRIYERAGFTLEHEAPHRAFGHDLIEQTWRLDLRTWSEPNEQGPARRRAPVAERAAAPS